MSSSSKWQYDYVEHYNLDANIIEKYLRERMGNYKFFVTVSTLLACPVLIQMRL